MNQVNIALTVLLLKPSKAYHSHPVSKFSLALVWMNFHKQFLQNYTSMAFHYVALTNSPPPQENSCTCKSKYTWVNIWQEDWQNFHNLTSQVAWWCRKERFKIRFFKSQVIIFHAYFGKVPQSTDLKKQSHFDILYKVATEIMHPSALFFIFFNFYYWSEVIRQEELKIFKV